MQVVVPWHVVEVVPVAIDLRRVIVPMRRIVVIASVVNPRTVDAMVPMVPINMAAIRGTMARIDATTIRVKMVSTPIHVTGATTIDSESTDLDTNLCLRLVRADHENQARSDDSERQ